MNVQAALFLTVKFNEKLSTSKNTKNTCLFLQTESAVNQLIKVLDPASTSCFYIIMLQSERHCFDVKVAAGLLLSESDAQRASGRLL